MYKSLGLGSCGILVLLVAGCSADGSDAGGDVGSAEIAITQVPSDVRCLRIVAAGSRVRQQAFDVMPGQSSILALNGLPTGAVTFSGDAFASACSQVSPMATPTYVADPVVAQVQLPAVAQVALVMRRNGQADVSVDFETDTGPMCVGNPCMSDAACCAGTTCAVDPSGTASCQPSTCGVAGTPCMSSATCCAGTACVADASGTATCQTSTCGAVGTPCMSSATCCAGTACVADASGTATCQTSTCGAVGTPCMSSAACCAGTACVADPSGTATCQ